MRRSQSIGQCQEKGEGKQRMIIVCMGEGKKKDFPLSYLVDNDETKLKHLN